MPDYDVHEVSGDIVAQTQIEEADVAGNPVVRLVNRSAHYEMIRYGTRYMRLRDPGGEALAEAVPDVKDTFAEGVHDATIEFFTG